MQKDLTILEARLNVTFKNKNLLLEALTHRSYPNKCRGWPVGHNERLELLGDAIIELIVTEYIFHAFPHKSEGELTELRKAFVCMTMLSKVAAELGIRDFLFLSRGQEKDSIRANQLILGSAFEALVAALYLDQGYECSRVFLARVLLSRLEEVFALRLHKDAKSVFQEVAQERLEITPTYQILDERGPDHAKRFVVGVYLNTTFVAKGIGPSKQQAETKAAEAALIIKGWQ